MIEDFLIPFHVQRSKVLDAMGDMEAALRELLNRNGIKPASETLGQLCEKARGLKANPRLSKALLSTLQSLLDRCEALIAIRNDIVHSRMHKMTVGDLKSACFIHTQPRGPYGTQARILTLEDLQIIACDARGVAGELRAVKVTPASSPRPPAQGAAGDP